MMRYIRYLFLGIIGACLILLAVANRGAVTLAVLPSEMAAYLGQPLAYEVPLFVVIFGSVVAGLMIGFILEWLREHRHRSDARIHKREKEKLERQVKGMKRRDAKGQDDVLALLEDPASAR